MFDRVLSQGLTPSRSPAHLLLLQSNTTNLHETHENLNPKINFYGGKIRVYFHMTRKFTSYVTLDASKNIKFSRLNIIYFPVISEVSIHLDIRSIADDAAQVQHGRMT
jgi:hypothetical protein